MPLAAELFDYALPPHLIAQTPAALRDHSKLLVANRASRTLTHRLFADLPLLLGSGDRLFRNNAAVLTARLNAVRPTGGHVECFLLRPSASPDTWECLIKPGRKLPIGAIFIHPARAFTGEVVAKNSGDGSAFVRFTTPDREPIVDIAGRLGAVPLPPYIHRSADAPRDPDLERYQTVYAEGTRRVAVAAPTAGLHFTPELLSKLAANGVGTADVTLHVGLGTFKPVTTATIEAHTIHREVYEIPVGTQRALFPPLAGRRVAVGTTTVRSIEDFLTAHSAALEHTHVAETGIFIYPPHSFKGVDALITNFHQPRSTLLCLVAAFLSPGSTDGIPWLREIYQEAIARHYRFLSYGDAMLIL